MANVWINELHYDNEGMDANEFIEIAGRAGTDLTGWSLALYDSVGGGGVYSTINLSGILADMNNGIGMISVDAAGIQNGGSINTPSPDGIALVDQFGQVVEFISYEGTFTPASGPAAGITSVNIGVAETGTGPATGSIQRTGTGGHASEFTTWAVTDVNTKNAVNDGQTFIDPSLEQIVIGHDGPGALQEGSSGVTNYYFVVERTGPVFSSATVNWAVTGSGANPADAADFGGTFPSGTVTMPAGFPAASIVVTVIGDRTAEADEGFTVTLSDPSTGFRLEIASVDAVILNDDAPNAAPNAVDDVASTDEDTPVTIDVLANDIDANGDPLTIVAAGGGAPEATHGTVAVVDGQLVYTPDANYNGSDQIAYTITDGEFVSSASVEVTIAAVNDSPTANDDSGFATERDTPLTIPIASLLGNDSDVDNDALTLAAVSALGDDSARIEGDNIIFTPGADGTGSFEYTVDDGHGGTGTATVSVTIDPFKTISGSESGDFLIGTSGQDRILALGGDDVVYDGAANDIVDGGAGDDALFGGAGDDALFGGAGNDVLIDISGTNRLDGGAGDDTLVGSQSDGDAFVFRAGYGDDVVSNFYANDVIELDSSLAGSFSEAMAHASRYKGGVLFTFDDDTLFLAGAKLGDLRADDFTFV